MSAYLLAALTGTLGMVLLGVSVHGLRRRKPGYAPRFIPCGAPSPDGASDCLWPSLHDGWCTDGKLEWHGDVWAISPYDDTQAGPTLRGDYDPEPPQELVLKQAWVDCGEDDYTPATVALNPAWLLQKFPAWLRPPVRLIAFVAVYGFIPAVFWTIGQICTYW